MEPNIILVITEISWEIIREEVILGSSDYRSIYIFSTNHPTTHRLRHLMTDHNYDMSQAMQNMGYNQGTNLGYYVGAETMEIKHKNPLDIRKSHVISRDFYVLFLQIILQRTINHFQSFRNTFGIHVCSF